MPTRYRWADLAICRAGALTVAELSLAGMPSLLIPYAHAADDHQTANARALEEAGAARRIEATPLDSQALAQTIAEFVRTPARLGPMRSAARKLARPNAAQEIIDYCVARLTGEPTASAAQPAGSATHTSVSQEDASCSAS